MKIVQKLSKIAGLYKSPSGIPHGPRGSCQPVKELDEVLSYTDKEFDGVIELESPSGRRGVLMSYELFESLQTTLKLCADPAYAKEIMRRHNAPDEEFEEIG